MLLGQKMDIFLDWYFFCQRTKYFRIKVFPNLTLLTLRLVQELSILSMCRRTLGIFLFRGSGKLRNPSLLSTQPSAASAATAALPSCFS